MKRLLTKLRKLGNPFNTLFGRMVVLMVIMLIADHSVWLVTFGRERPRVHSGQIERDTLLSVSALQQLDAINASSQPDLVLRASLQAALQGVRRVSVDAADAPSVTHDGADQSPPNMPDFATDAGPGPGPGGPGPGLPPPDAPGFQAGLIPHGPPIFVRGMQPPPDSGDFKRGLIQALPPGTKVSLRPPPTAEIWVLLPGARAWDVIPVLDARAPGQAYNGVFIELALAILFAIAAAWQLQKPLAELARAATNFRPYRPPVAVRERGPREVKRVIRHFNDTVKELYEIEQDREVMLAGVAHDLRAPITRVRARAEVIADMRLAGGFIRDADSLSQIVDQFLDFSKLSVDESPPVSVETFCTAQWGNPESHVERPAEVRLAFRAGEAFMLPVTDIERILSNLIENALTYGAGPVDIQTCRVSENQSSSASENADFWELSVRDHGKGIPAAKLGMATRPFVRLDASRGGDAHCGLGLAIVNKLVQRHGGRLTLSNASGGGLLAVMRFAAV